MYFFKYYSVKIFLVFLLMILGNDWLTGQSAHQLRRGGDKAFDKGEYIDAEELYRKALREEPEVKGHFNLGNSLYSQQRFDEALEQYDKAIARSDNPLIQSKAYFNKGNTLFGQQKLGESIEAYKESLRLNAKDEEAKRNLFLSQQLLKQQQKQQQQQQQDQQQDQNQDKEQEQQEQQQGEEQQEKQEQKDKEGKEQEEQKEEKIEQEKDESENGEEESSAAQDSLKGKEINREELMKLLKAIEEEDKKIQQKLRRGTAGKKRSEKDW